MLAAGESQQVKNVAEIIQRVRPDVLLLNEFDYDSSGAALRLFQENFLPGNLIPQPFYLPDEVDVLRLSSKSHWDLPIRIGGERTHFLVSHPTPPVFDGPEDRNGRRNHDEIRFWADYVTPSRNRYIYDDAGRRGGLNPSEHFVIAGDQNADPIDGDSVPGAIQQLLNNKRINTRVTPASPGGPEQSAKQGQVNAKHRGNPAFDTADFDDRLADPNATPPRPADAAGNLRVDYVLPDRRTDIERSYVFWPLESDPLFRLVGTFDFRRLPDGNGFPSSDHRLVAVDVEGDD